jgi:hypothetical protein
MVILTKTGEKGRKFFRDELKDATGADKVKDDDVVLVTYISDISPVSFRKPGFMVLPENKNAIITDPPLERFWLP